MRNGFEWKYWIGVQANNHVTNLMDEYFRFFKNVFHSFDPAHPAVAINLPVKLFEI